MLIGNQINLPPTSASGFPIIINSNSFLVFFKAKNLVPSLAPVSHSISWEIPPKPEHLKSDYVYLFIYFCLFVFSGPHPQHMEVPRLEF